ncbi:hypothetical protein CsSME_00029324 [Camellia sinensis var. sinensis]
MFPLIFAIAIAIVGEELFASVREKNGESVGGVGGVFPWKCIWAMGSPSKVAFFVWTAALGYVQTAVVAKEALEGHCIYDGGFCKLHISYSRHTDLSIKVNNDRSRDYTIPNAPMLNVQPSILGHQPLPMGGMGSHHQYNGPQFPQAPEGLAAPQPSAGWGLQL